jgi:xanthine dehydrogenase molybdopterin-binding subunit B
LAIDKSGKVTIYSGKVDLGTGVYTALQQIVADELDVPMNRIEMIQGDTLLTPDQGKTIRIVGRDIRVPLVVMARLARDVQTAVDFAHFEHLIAQNHPRP